MKYFILLLLLIPVLEFGQDKNYIQEIKNHRADLNAFYTNSKTSPLSKRKLKQFKSLPFFSVDEQFKVKAKLKYTFNSPVFYMKTTGSYADPYQQYALAIFKIKEQEFTLCIYQNISLKKKKGYENHLFIPFTDNSNGKMTYSGGRYIDASIPKTPTGYIILDFNKAYNPYCAYNKKYACPIPPKENHLDIDVLAGVQMVRNY